GARRRGRGLASAGAAGAGEPARGARHALLRRVPRGVGAPASGRRALRVAAGVSVAAATVLGGAGAPAWRLREARERGSARAGGGLGGAVRGARVGDDTQRGDGAGRAPGGRSGGGARGALGGACAGG